MLRMSAAGAHLNAVAGLNLSYYIGKNLLSTNYYIYH